MTGILFAVLGTVRVRPAGAALLLAALLAACAGDETPRPMHIAAHVEAETVKVEVADIPTGRELTTLVLVDPAGRERSEEHTSELQSLMRISYAVLCLTKKNTTATHSST